MPKLYPLTFTGLFLLTAVIAPAQITPPIEAKTQMVRDSVKLVKKKGHVIRRELRTIPGESFSREDLIRSQRELANLQYFKENTADTSDKKKEALQTPDCRETNTINNPEKAEAYPYITADGLRLYFTSDRQGGFGRLFISTRKSIDDVFGKPKVLSRHLADGYYASTLTADELTLCMVKSGDMYISIRKNIYEEFPEPTEVKGISGNYHFGPSISPDGKEIAITVTVNGTDVIRVYKRTGLYTVKEFNDLPIPQGDEPGPGQFSKDGLSYLFSLETKGSEFLWRYSRTSVNDNFADLQQLPVQLKALTNNVQPSVNGDGSILVFVTSPTSTWEDDDIVLVNDVKGINSPEQFTTVASNDANTMKVMSKVSAAQLKVYPNPFNTTVNIEIKELPAEGALFNLYDVGGKRVRQEKINNLITNMSFDRMTAGVYVYHVLDGKGRLISSGKLVKAL